MAKKTRQQIKAIKARGRHRNFNSLSHEIAQNQDVTLASARSIVGAIKARQIERFGSHTKNGHTFVNQ